MKAPKLWGTALQRQNLAKQPRLLGAIRRQPGNLGLRGLELRARHAVAMNRSLASDPPRQFCGQMSLISSDNIVQKGLGMRAPLERYCPLISGAKGAGTFAPPARSPRWGFGGAARRRKTEPRISMSNSTKKRTMASAPAAVPTTKSARHSADDPGPQRADRDSSNRVSSRCCNHPQAQRSKR